MFEFKIFETNGMAFAHQMALRLFLPWRHEQDHFFPIPLAKNKKFSCLAKEERNEKERSFSFVVNERKTTKKFVCRVESKPTLASYMLYVPYLAKPSYMSRSYLRYTANVSCTPAHLNFDTHRGTLNSSILLSKYDLLGYEFACPALLLIDRLTDASWGPFLSQKSLLLGESSHHYRRTPLK